MTQIQIGSYLDQIKQALEKIAGVKLSYPVFFENLAIFEIYGVENRDQFNSKLTEYNDITNSIAGVEFSTQLYTIGNSNIYYTYSFDDSIVLRNGHGEYNLSRGEYIIVRVNMPIIILGEQNE